MFICPLVQQYMLCVGVSYRSVEVFDCFVLLFKLRSQGHDAAAAVLREFAGVVVHVVAAVVVVDTQWDSLGGSTVGECGVWRRYTLVV